MEGADKVSVIGYIQPFIYYNCKGTAALRCSGGCLGLN